MNFTALYTRYEKPTTPLLCLYDTIRALCTFGKYNIQYFRLKVKTMDYYLIDFGYDTQIQQLYFMHYHDKFLLFWLFITNP